MTVNERTALASRVLESSTSAQAIVGKIDALFASQNRSDAPGCTVAVSLGGNLLYRAAFGLANVEHGVANLPSTKMPIGSVTKQFTCAAVLILAAEGRLDLNEPIGRLIPELPLKQRVVSLRQLMTHTSGIRCYLDQWAFNGYKTMPVGHPLAMQLRQREVNFEPGTGAAYCNGGYLLLSLAIERASGMPFDAFLKKRIFDPLDMRETSLPRAQWPVQRGAATTYLPAKNEGDSQPDATDWRHGIAISEVMMGEGGIVSTVDDMLRWAAFLRLESGPVSLLNLTAPPKVTSGHVPGYRLGVIAETWRGVRLVQHAGGLMGANSSLVMAPDAKLDVVVLFNKNAPATDLALQVVEVVLEDQLARPAPAPTTPDYSALLGNYRCDATEFVFGFVDQEGKLGLSICGSSAASFETRDVGPEILPLHVDLGTGDLRFRAGRTTGAPLEAVEYLDGCTWRKAERIKQSELTPAEIVGNADVSFENEDTRAILTFAHHDGQLIIHARGEYSGTVFTVATFGEDTLRLTSSEFKSVMLARVVRRDVGSMEVIVSTPRTRRTVFTQVGVGGQA